MGKKYLILLITSLLLTGCFSKNKEKVRQPDDDIQQEIPSIQPDTSNDEEEKVVKNKFPLLVENHNFHFVADWLSDTEIVYVEKDPQFYYVKTYDIVSGNIETVYRDSSIIVDVLIHPSKDFILLHTTNNPSSAIVKVITTEGAFLDEISIASSELQIEWNGLDPSLILFTAFYPDWNFDVFLFNQKEQDFRLLTLDDPFPKWLGQESIVINEMNGHPLDGSNLNLYHYRSDTWEHLDLSQIVYFETFQNSLLVQKVEDDSYAQFILFNDGKELASWKMPLVSNYSEWVIPGISWINETELFFASSSVSGQLDEINDNQHLVRVVDGFQEAIINKDVNGILRCSPSGKHCISGYRADTLVNTETKQQVKWLEINDNHDFQ